MTQSELRKELERNLTKSVSMSYEEVIKVRKLAAKLAEGKS